MPIFQLHIVNSDFSSCGECDADDVRAAQKQGLKAALQMGTDEMCDGSPFFGAEVRVEADGEVKERFLVSMGQSPLQ
jgi:hypothetical protein